MVFNCFNQVSITTVYILVILFTIIQTVCIDCPAVVKGFTVCKYEFTITASVSQGKLFFQVVTTSRNEFTIIVICTFIFVTSNSQHTAIFT